MEIIINDNGNGITGQFNVSITMYFPYEDKEEKKKEAEKIKQILLELSD